MAAIHICTNLFHGIKIQRLLIIISIIVPVLIVSQCYIYPYAKTSFLPLDVKSSNILTLQNVTSLNHSEITGFQQVHFTDAIIHVKNTKERTDYIAEKKGERGFGLTSDAAKSMIYGKGAASEESLVMPYGNFTVDNDVMSGSVEFGYNPLKKEVILDNSYKRVTRGEDSNNLKTSEIRNHISIVSNQSQEFIVDPRKSDHFNRTEEMIEKDTMTEQGKNVSITLDGRAQYDRSILKSLEVPSISISQMNALLSLRHNSSCLKVWIST